MRRILVVDDDLHVGRAIHVWLKHHGFRVSTADSGPGGLAALDNASFDLMIVDVFMPQMRGFEAIRLFHERAPTVPLIAISGYAFADTETSGAEFLRAASAPCHDARRGRRRGRQDEIRRRDGHRGIRGDETGRREAIMTRGGVSVQALAERRRNAPLLE
jgi:CheY-like chemotaxis protein